MRVLCRKWVIESWEGKRREWTEGMMVGKDLISGLFSIQSLILHIGQGCLMGYMIVHLRMYFLSEFIEATRED